MDKIVLSYYDSILRQSDIQILETKQWINDNIIEFFYEYLTNDLFKEYQNEFICFSPSLVQLIKMIDDNDNQSIEEIIKPLNIATRKLLLIPLNDNMTINYGGTHWSLLVYRQNSEKFEYYDSNPARDFTIYKNFILKISKLLNSKKAAKNIEIIDCHQQQDSYNCGVHLICNSQAVLENYFNFNDEKSIKSLLTLDQIEMYRKKLLEIIESLKE